MIELSKKALLLAIRSLAVNPRSARIRWPGFRRGRKSLFSTTNRSLEFPENPWETKLNTVVNKSMELDGCVAFVFTVEKRLHTQVTLVLNEYFCSINDGNSVRNMIIW